MFNIYLGQNRVSSFNSSSIIIQPTGDDIAKIFSQHSIKMGQIYYELQICD